MEFHTTPPPSLGPYQYEATAIVTLDPVHAGHEADEGNILTRTISGGRRSSIGSQGRRSSFNGPKEGVLDPEHGGGLRKTFSGGRRKSLDAAAAKAEMLKDPNAPSPTTAKASPPPVPAEASALAPSADRQEAKGGKWSAKVVVGVSPTHVILVLPPPSTLAPYSSVTHSTFFGSSSSPTTGAHDGSTSIGDKIKGIFRRGSKDAAAEEAHAHAEAPAPAPIPLAYPSYINGNAVTHILVPIGDVIHDSLKMVDDKNQVGVRIKINARFASLIHPMLDSMGIDESWGRSGQIKFSFNRQWIGAKAEAEVLLAAIETAIENKRNGIVATDNALSHAQADLKTETGARRVSTVGTESSGAKVEG